MLFIQTNPASLFTVYGFQNNLAPTTGSVLTTSGANVNGNVGGTAACFQFPQYLDTIKYFALNYNTK